MTSVGAIIVEVPTAAAMAELGARLALILRAGDLLIATGPLGAGKTALAQGIGLGLGLTPGTVRSPTYTIADRHDGGRLPFAHLDAWRLASAAELDDLDLDLADAVTYVEWGSERAEQLADSHLRVDIARPGLDERRVVTLTPVGGDWADRLALL